MNYLALITVGSFIISVIAVSIAVHTKLQRRESQELRKLAQKLADVTQTADILITELRNPRTHEDLNVDLQEIAREALSCKHETGSETVLIALSPIESLSSEEEITDYTELVNKHKSGEYFSLNVVVGDREKMYTTKRKPLLHNPIRNSSYLYEYLDDIKQEHSEKMSEFDDSLLEDFEAHLDKIVNSSSKNITDAKNRFNFNINDFETTEEIGDYVFEETFYYDGIEEDLETLEELLEEVEELRKTVLQASYS